MNYRKLGQGTHCTKMGADSLAKLHQCPRIYRPKPQISGFQWKKGFFGRPYFVFFQKLFFHFLKQVNLANVCMDKHCPKAVLDKITQNNGQSRHFCNRKSDKQEDTHKKDVIPIKTIKNLLKLFTHYYCYLRVPNLSS